MVTRTDEHNSSDSRRPEPVARPARDSLVGRTSFSASGPHAVAPANAVGGAALVDGRTVGTVNTYAAKTSYRQVVFTRTLGTTITTHKVQLRILSGSTPGRSAVALDALMVTRWADCPGRETVGTPGWLPGQGVRRVVLSVGDGGSAVEEGTARVRAAPRPRPPERRTPSRRCTALTRVPRTVMRSRSR
jgi:hypothetical protein